MEIRRGAVVTVALAGTSANHVLRSCFAPIISPRIKSSAWSRSPLLKGGGIAPDRYHTIDRKRLDGPSQAMIDTLQSVRVQRIGGIVGQLAAADVRRITRAVAVYLGFAD